MVDDLWVVVLGYAFVLLLVQVAVYLYLSDGRGKESHDRAVPAAAGGDGGAPVDDSTGTRDYRRCPHCGAPNEADGTFTHCRQCAGSLRG